MSALAALGAFTLGLLAALGRVTIFAGQTLSHILRPPFYGREFAVALLNIGWLSLPVVGLTAIWDMGDALVPGQRDQQNGPALYRKARGRKIPLRTSGSTVARAGTPCPPLPGCTKPRPNIIFQRRFTMARAIKGCWATTWSTNR